MSFVPSLLLSPTVSKGPIVSVNLIHFFLSYKKFTNCRLSEASTGSVQLKKSVLKTLAKFTGKHLCQSLFLNKVSGLWHRCFPVNFAKFLRTPFLQNTSRRLLLDSDTFLNALYISIEVFRCFHDG